MEILLLKASLSRAFDDNLVQDQKYFYTVYTYDNNFVFSEGVRIEATPRDRIIPRGVAKVDSTLLVGTGVVLDENVIAAWHMDEGGGSKLYDFKGNTDLEINRQSPIWSQVDNPSGPYNLRFNGNSVEAFAEDPLNNLSISSEFSFLAWIYPYELSEQASIISRHNSQTNYSVLLNSNGGIDVTFNGTTYSSTDNILTEDAWNHVAVTANESGYKIYVSGPTDRRNICLAKYCIKSRH